MPLEYGYSEETRLGKAYDTRLLRQIYPFVKPYRIFILISILLVVFITGLDLALPYLTKIAIDHYIVPQSVPPKRIVAKKGTADLRYLKVDLRDSRIKAIVRKHPALFEIEGESAWIPQEKLAGFLPEEITALRQKDLTGVGWIAAAFVGIILVHFILNFLQIYLMEYAGQQVMHDLRLTLFKHVTGLSLPFFNRNPVGRLVTRVTNDVQNMHEFFTSVIVFVFQDAFLLIGIAVVLLGINWKLALAAFTILPFVLLAVIRFSHLARDAFRILRVKLAEINSRFSETIGGIRVIQLFLQEQHNFRSFARLNHENFLAGMQQIQVFAVFMPVIELLGAVATAIVIFYGGGSVISGAISLGSLAAFLSYMRMFFRPIRDIAEKYNVMQDALSSAERLFLLLETDEKDAPVSLPEPAPLEKIERINFEAVTFAYIPGEPVLKQVSFEIAAGETVAVVGPTGSGKTSLINLLIRFYDPQDGCVRINQTDIRTLDPAQLRGRMALVMQEPFLFSETIRSNLFANAPMLGPEKETALLEAASLTALLKQLPEGLDTLLSEGGATLSSGQRQLLSIARAIARQPDLIILDEATSYVDSETEQKIEAAMTHLMQNRTAIVIAHRLSTARRADRIVVLNRGRIVDIGTHRELMQARGFYYRLNRLNNSTEG